MRESDDLYKILQLHPSAESEVIQAAYRRLARKYHPDVNNSPEAEEIMTNLNRAYRILGDSNRRATYDYQCSEAQDTGTSNTEQSYASDEEERRTYSGASKEDIYSGGSRHTTPQTPSETQSAHTFEHLGSELKLIGIISLIVIVFLVILVLLVF